MWPILMEKQRIDSACLPRKISTCSPKINYSSTLGPSRIYPSAKKRTTTLSTSTTPKYPLFDPICHSLPHLSITTVSPPVSKNSHIIFPDRSRYIESMHTHWLMPIQVLALLLTPVAAQTIAGLTNCSGVETNTLSIRSKGTTSTSTTVTFNLIFPNDSPRVFVSLCSLQLPLETVSLSHRIMNVTQRGFTHEYTLLGRISTISIVYIAYDYHIHNYFSICDVELLLQTSPSGAAAYYKVSYLTPLNQTDSYNLNCFLQGFSGLTILSQSPLITIDAVPMDLNYYLVKINLGNATLEKVSFVRVVLMKSMMNISIGNPFAETDTVMDWADSNMPSSKVLTAYLSVGLFYGLKGIFSSNVTISDFIFTGNIQRIQIGYMMIMELSCPANQFYLPTGYCYSLTSAYYYQVNSMLVPCPYTCYQCVGPSTSQCQSCVDSWQRVLQSGSCVCASGYYDVGKQVCPKCSDAISNCDTCFDNVTCTACVAGCQIIQFNFSYCDCPSNINSNFTFGCSIGYYYEFEEEQCVCMPMTYLTIGGSCAACGVGCYICRNSPNECTSCLNMYTYYNKTCIFFFSAMSLLGSADVPNFPTVRCVHWRGLICVSVCNSYYYNFNCYGQCPIGTFPLTFPGKYCQPCKGSCLDCFNYTICLKCAPYNYYFNSSTLSCSSCSPNCLQCSDRLHCLVCVQPYSLSSGFCLLPLQQNTSNTSNPTNETSPNCNGGVGCEDCLYESVCANCLPDYLLNTSSGQCLPCSPLFHSPVCQELCGDGVIINGQCDDGNTRNGDGCNSTCFVEPNYLCFYQQNTSRSASSVSTSVSRSVSTSVSTSVSRSVCYFAASTVWSATFQYINRNAIVIRVGLTPPPADPLPISMYCNFNSSQLALVSGDTWEYTVNYDAVSLSGRKGRPSSFCRWEMRNMTLRVMVDATVEDYAPGGEYYMWLVKVAVLSVMVLGLLQTNAYSPLRIIAIEFIAKQGGGYWLYEGLSVLILNFSHCETTELVCSRESLRNIIFIYVTVVFLLQGVLLLIRALDYASLVSYYKQYKQRVYQRLYMCYELVVLHRLYTITLLGPLELYIFTPVHIIIIVLAKLHYYRNNHHPEIYLPCLAENIYLPLLALIDGVPYFPFVVILFNVYLLTVARHESQQGKEGIGKKEAAMDRASIVSIVLMSLRQTTILFERFTRVAGGVVGNVLLLASVVVAAGGAWWSAATKVYQFCLRSEEVDTDIGDLD